MAMGVASLPVNMTQPPNSLTSKDSSEQCCAPGKKAEVCQL